MRTLGYGVPHICRKNGLWCVEWIGLQPDALVEAATSWLRMQIHLGYL